ncbi:WD40 repeat domain-containing protein [Actinomadura terrae]|uniref:WD40 repeat domain-containing protein n=1 Tax=Actinomadura terrae TaxID=604353 RepID=UPI001FA7A393|nr:hypothetical protein [Actinomadura terrae]
MWDITGPRRPRPLPPIRTGDAGGTHWAAFAPGGRVLATADVGQSIRLWDVHDPARTRPLGPPLTGHTAPVNWTGFTPNGHTLASASGDHTLRLWDVHDPARPAPLGRGLTADHIAPINTAALADGGRLLVSAGDDRVLQLTSLRLPRAIEHICATTHNNLMESQWRQHVTELRYTPPCRAHPCKFFATSPPPAQAPQPRLAPLMSRTLPLLPERSL